MIGLSPWPDWAGRCAPLKLMCCPRKLVYIKEPAGFCCYLSILQFLCTYINHEIVVVKCQSAIKSLLYWTTLKSQNNSLHLCNFNSLTPVPGSLRALLLIKTTAEYNFYAVSVRILCKIVNCYRIRIFCVE